MQECLDISGHLAFNRRRLSDIALSLCKATCGQKNTVCYVKLFLKTGCTNKLSEGGHTLFCPLYGAVAVY